jgi:hypothetical protein
MASVKFVMKTCGYDTHAVGHDPGHSSQVFTTHASPNHEALVIYDRLHKATTAMTFDLQISN